MSDDELTPEKLQAAIERLVREKQRRAEGKPAAPVYPAVERVIVADLVVKSVRDVTHNSKPRPRKAPKAREARLVPVPFFTQTGKPTASDPGGTIAEGYYVTEGKQLALCDAAGEPGEWRPIHERGELYTARQALRNRLAARRTGVDHSPIQYRKTGWM
jgi:hypothetical protein